MKTFYKQWQSFDSNTKIKYLKKLEEESPFKVVHQVVAGINDYTRSVRSESCRVLLLLSDRVDKFLGDGFGTNGDIQKDIQCEIFSIPIFSALQKTLSSELVKIYIKALLTSGRIGAEAAWKYFVMGKIPPQIFIDTVRRLEPKLIMRFIFQYSFSAHYDRRKYYSIIKSLLKHVENYETIASFIAEIYDRQEDSGIQTLLFEGDFFEETFKRLDFFNKIICNYLKSDNPYMMLSGIKIAVVTKNPDLLLNVSLLADAGNDLHVRLLSIEVTGKFLNEFKDRFSRVLYFLLNDDRPVIVTAALKALCSSGDNYSIDKALQILRNDPAVRAGLFKEFTGLDSQIQISLIGRLDDEEKHDYKKIIIRSVFKGQNERVLNLLGYVAGNSGYKVNDDTFALLCKPEELKKLKLTKEINSLEPRELKTLKPRKGFLGKLSGLVHKDPVSLLKNHISDDILILVDEIFHDLVLKDMKLSNVDFGGAVFINCNFTGCTFENIEFSEARIEGSNFDSTAFICCRLSNTIINKTSAELSEFKFCDLSNSKISSTDFSGASFYGSFFSSSNLIKTDFSGSAFYSSFFSGCKALKSVFENSDFWRSDYFRIAMRDCKTDNSRIDDYGAEIYLNNPGCDPITVEVDDTIISLLQKIINDELLKEVLLISELYKLRNNFINYNCMHREFAHDSFSKGVSDLFELVPFLIHSPLMLINEKYFGNEFAGKKADFMTLYGCSGINRYVPDHYAETLAVKYFKIDPKHLIKTTANNIEALFTIGSTGSVAQTVDSDIDYWVCIKTSVMNEESQKYLRNKLKVIEKWAKLKFGTEIHFFIVDIEKARLNLFGESDRESSGSAQGKILKEEFYRTMILVAGKIPFWCVVPEGVRGDSYKSLFDTMSCYTKDYIDLGNVSGIPFGEYFGASMWQMFKSLKSPYKSVMKMALLEKYLTKNKNDNLLCNILKKRWRSKKGYINTDPYILLFSEVISNYSSKPGIRKMIEICFFLKLGVRSMKELDSSVLKIRKKLIEACVKKFLWNLETIYDSGYFSEWPYDRIAILDKDIKEFMILTYRNVTGIMTGKKSESKLITDEDLTILGRRMFVQFSERPEKVLSLPAVAEREPLFDNLYINYRKQYGSKNINGVWEVFYENDRKKRVEGNESAVLKNVLHIEEVAAWIVYNKLNTASTILHLIPNETHVSLQEINELIRGISIFFRDDNESDDDSTAFLEKEVIKKILITANFGCPKKYHKIIQYTIIYNTSWGEFCTRSFESPGGINSIKTALDKAMEHIGLPWIEEIPGVMMPRMLTKYVLKDYKVNLL